MYKSADALNREKFIKQSLAQLIFMLRAHERHFPDNQEIPESFKYLLSDWVK